MDDIQIYKRKKEKVKQEACGWCLGWRGEVAEVALCVTNWPFFPLCLPRAPL